MKIKKILEISWIKSFVLCVYYFKIKEAIKLPILVSHKVSLYKLKGKVEMKNISFAKVRIGFSENRAFDNKRDYVVWHNEGIIVFNGSCKIGKGMKIAVSQNAILEIQDNVIFLGNSQVICGKHIMIGKNVLIGWGVMLLDYDAHSVIDNNGRRINIKDSLEIGEHVWIGARSSILKGVTISNDVIIAANSNVCKNLLESNAIYGGNPAKLIKNDVNWTI